MQRLFRIYIESKSINSRDEAPNSIKSISRDKQIGVSNLSFTSTHNHHDKLLLFVFLLKREYTSSMCIELCSRSNWLNVITRSIEAMARNSLKIPISSAKTENLCLELRKHCIAAETTKTPSISLGRCCCCTCNHSSSRHQVLILLHGIKARRCSEKNWHMIDRSMRVQWWRVGCGISVGLA